MKTFTYCRSCSDEHPLTAMVDGLCPKCVNRLAIPSPPPRSEPRSLRELDERCARERILAEKGTVGAKEEGWRCQDWKRVLNHA